MIQMLASEVKIRGLRYLQIKVQTPLMSLVNVVDHRALGWYLFHQSIFCKVGNRSVR